MSVQLWIGEVAKLLGVTTKTIRYYEEIGLLDEPVRTDSGYRVYNAQDLLRLYRIKQLQDLGLSLERIHVLLGQQERTPDTAQTAEEILCALEDELTAQIAELENRRAQIRELLGQSTVDPLRPADELPPTLRLLQEYLGEGLNLDSLQVQHAGQMWSELDRFLWNHAEYQQQQRELIGYMAEFPQARTQIVQVINRVADLGNAATSRASGPTEAEAAKMDMLVEEIIQMQEGNPILLKIFSFGDRLDQSKADILAQILTGAAEPTPLQQELFHRLAIRLNQER